MGLDSNPSSCILLGNWKKKNSWIGFQFFIFCYNWHTLSLRQLPARHWKLSWELTLTPFSSPTSSAAWTTTWKYLPPRPQASAMLWQAWWKHVRPTPCCLGPHCDSTPAAARWFGFSFPQRRPFWMVFHGKKGVLLAQSCSSEPWLAGERQSLAFNRTWWSWAGVPSAKSLLAFFKLGEIFQPPCSLTQPSQSKSGQGGVRLFSKPSPLLPLHTHTHTPP